MQPGKYTHVLNTASSAKMADVLVAALSEAVDVAVSVAFVKMTGLQLLLPALAAARRRKARIRVLTSTYLAVTEPQALRSLRAMDRLELRVQDGTPGFHGKAHLLVWREDHLGWIGSSNWSRSGLRDNIEWNSRIETKHSFDEAWKMFEELWIRPDVVHPEDTFLREYEVRWTLARMVNAGRPMEAVAEPVVRYAAQLTPTSLQKDALQRLAIQRAEGVSKALVVAATGVGKTLLAAFDACAAGAKKLLFIAHRKDIVSQAAREFARVFGGDFAPDVIFDGSEDAQRVAGGGVFRDAVFVTIQTLLGKGGAPLRERAWDYVVIDEFHHAEADRWKKTLLALNTRFLLGLTATPERADGRNVMDLCDGNVVFEVRLPEAIRQGALARFHYFGIADDDAVDYGSLPRAVDDETLGRVLSIDSRVDLVLAQAVEKGFDGVKRVGVGFCASVKHAEFMAREFDRRGQPAAVVHAQTDTTTRKALYDRVQDPADELQWLFVADVLNEGVDLPAINTVLFLRPTESPVVFLQQLGRGLRKHADTEVLTVLDFVGRHRGAFFGLLALHDPNGVPTVSSREVSRVLRTPLTPPEGCELLLEDKTIEVLEKVRTLARSRKQRVEDAYATARSLLERPPMPIDGHRIADLSLADVRSSHGGWRELRVAMKDAAEWELAVKPNDPLDRLLHVAERNFQLQRVEGYAALWASLDEDVGDVNVPLDRFFDEHPQWKVERRPSPDLEAAVASLLEKAQCSALRVDGAWIAPLRKTLTDEVKSSIRERLAVTLAIDYQLRHGGVLRAPSALQRFAAYARHEIVNHFEVQYDPTVHNLGVIHSTRFEGHVMLLARVDTSSAKAEHRYSNRVIDRSRVAWTSQNKMTPENRAGEIITKQKANGVRLHLFLAPSAHRPFRYLGEVRVERYEGSGPMHVTFALSEPLPDAVFEELTSGEE